MRMTDRSTVCQCSHRQQEHRSGIYHVVYMNNSPPQKEIRLHHLLIGEVGSSIKCSHLSLSGCSTGSLGTCTHIILRPPAYSLYFQCQYQIFIIPAMAPYSLPGIGCALISNSIPHRTVSKIFADCPVRMKENRTACKRKSTRQ